MSDPAPLTWEDHAVTLDRNALLRECDRMAFQLACLNEHVIELVAARHSQDQVTEIATNMLSILDMSGKTHDSSQVMIKDKIRKFFPILFQREGGQH